MTNISASKLIVQNLRKSFHSQRSAEPIRVFDDISFEASDRSGQSQSIDGAYVTERVGQLSKNADLSRFIL